MKDFHARRAHAVIGPAHTREPIVRFLGPGGDRVGRHRLARWPAKF